MPYVQSARIISETRQAFHGFLIPSWPYVLWAVELEDADGERWDFVVLNERENPEVPLLQCCLERKKPDEKGRFYCRDKASPMVLSEHPHQVVTMMLNRAIRAREAFLRRA